MEAEADVLLDQGRFDEGLALVGDFRTRVSDHPRLVYEEGLLLRHQGELTASRERLALAVAQDPSLGFAWYDLGEVTLLLGEREPAREAFTRALVGTEEHPSGWVVPLKLAEMAAQEQDTDDWDRWLRECFRRGFSLALVPDNPAWADQWRAHLAHPRLGDVLRRLATVYGEESALERLAAPD